MPTHPNPVTDAFNPSNLFNPMAFWTDVSLNALDRTLASTQNISDGVDRLARAGASASVEKVTQHSAGRSATRDVADMPTDMGLGLALRMQRTTFELMIQGWQQWMAAFGTLASLGAGSTFRDTVERQNPWLKNMRESLTGEAQSDLARRASTVARRPNGEDREAHSGRDATEHAAATSGARRPRGGSAGAKRKTRASGRSHREA